MSGRNYYFLISSLPLLKLGEAVPFSSDEFLARCELSLEPERLAALAGVGLVPRLAEEPVSETHRQWNAHETYLRNYLVQERAAALRVAAESWRRSEPEVFPGLRRQFEEALHAAHPLARQRRLDEIRWQVLDDLMVRHEFDFDALVIYRLRLLLAEEWVGHDRGRGAENLQKLIESGLEQAEAVRQVENG